MTDTTDQQAVTVAQEDREAAATLVEWHTKVAREWETVDGGTMQFFTKDMPRATRAGTWDEHAVVQAFARHRLASVSSASAEIPAGMKPWTGGDRAPGDWDGGPVLWRNGRIGASPAVPAWEQWCRRTDPDGRDIIAYTPEPVPATNQAGEVEERDRLVRSHGMKPWSGGSEAPTDWNGGRVLLACGQLWHPYQSDDEPNWQNDVSETGYLEPGCIIGYVARAETVHDAAIKAALCLSGFAGEGISIEGHEDPADAWSRVARAVGLPDGDDDDLRAIMDGVIDGVGLREVIIAAITNADAAFGYSYRMTGLVDGVETHTLFMDGFEPVSFEDREDGGQLIAERRNQLRADAVLAALATQPATSQAVPDSDWAGDWQGDTPSDRAANLARGRQPATSQEGECSARNVELEAYLRAERLCAQYSSLAEEDRISAKEPVDRAYHNGRVRGAYDAGKMIANLSCVSQPATSQEAIEAGKVVLEGRGDGTYSEAEDAIRKLIAATPTPPSLSEDLRETLSDMLEAFTNSECGEVDRRLAVETARAALAQVKAS